MQWSLVPRWHIKLSRFQNYIETWHKICWLSSSQIWQTSLLNKTVEVEVRYRYILFWLWTLCCTNNQLVKFLRWSWSAEFSYCVSLSQESFVKIRRRVLQRMWIIGTTFIIDFAINYFFKSTLNEMWDISTRVRVGYIDLDINYYLYKTFQKYFVVYYFDM